MYKCWLKTTASRMLVFLLAIEEVTDSSSSAHGGSPNCKSFCSRLVHSTIKLERFSCVCNVVFLCTIRQPNGDSFSFWKRAKAMASQAGSISLNIYMVHIPWFYTLIMWLSPMVEWFWHFCNCNCILVYTSLKIVT